MGVLQNVEIAMLGEITHLQAIVEDLTVLTEDPHKLPPASEQVRGGKGVTLLPIPLPLMGKRDLKLGLLLLSVCKSRTLESH